MSPSKIIRRDLSKDPEAPSKAVSDPELHAALLALGFTSIGFYESSVPGLLTLKQINQRFGPPDSDFLFNALETGQINEIFGSSEQNTFATIENHFGQYLLVYITITEDGTIVDTTMKPDRAPQASEKIIGAPKTTLFNFPGQIAAKVRKFAYGVPAIWPREDRPQAAYHLELVETKNADVLYKRHQTRLRELLKPNQIILPHTTLALYLCISKRIELIAGYMQTLTVRLMSASHILNFVILSFYTVILMLQTIIPQTISIPLICLSPLLPVLFMHIEFGFIRTTIIPALPGPKPESVPALMDQVTVFR